jgi:hypothetical protein
VMTEKSVQEIRSQVKGFEAEVEVQ